MLKETETPIADISCVSGECPECGNLLSNTLQVKKHEDKKQSLPVPFRTAYEANARLTFGIEQIDKFLDLKLGDCVGIIGGNYASMFVARLCAHALMYIRQGGFASQSVVIIDGGNSYTVYRYIINFARQYGLDLKPSIRRVLVTRGFTIDQLAGLIVRKLSSFIQQFNAKVVVIPNLLKMFAEDPQINFSEAKYLINEIAKAIKKVSVDIIIAVSFAHAKYEEMMLPVFSKRVEIAIEEKKLKVNLYNHRKVRQLSLTDRDMRVV